MKATDIISKVKAEIELKNISKYAIAKKLKVSQSTVANWLNGKTYPDLHQFISLLHILEIELEINIL